jgi:cytochrome c553
MKIGRVEGTFVTVLSFLATGAALLLCSSLAVAQDLTPDHVEFFEKSIRPVLADKCYRCHGEDVEKLKGGLNLSYRDGLLKGGASGPALVAGQAGKSLILEAISYANEDLQMPPKEKLPDETIANFRQWVAMGAPDPRDDPLPQEGLEDATTWAAIRDARRSWWSYQPIERPEPPIVNDTEWADHPVDQFIRAKLDEAELSPAAVAEPRALIRRLSFVLTGMPPTPKDIEQFVAAAAVDRQAAVEESVDRLMASPHFGERWARHWMDWIRYAETHGSESDPAIPNVWRYRDYLIRALNADVPYDQLVREHVAGDLLPEPRINEALQINESIVGTAQYRLVQHGYSPTDALDEQARFTEDQIDALSKGFLATTMACARCHNHKFDPVSQKDYYALYGIMASSRPASRTIDTQDRLDTNKDELAALKPRLREAMAESWLAASAVVGEELLRPDGPWLEAIEPSAKDEEEEEKEKERKEPEDAALNYRSGKSWQSDRDPLTVWRQLRALSGDAFKGEWTKLRNQWRESEDRIRQRKTNNYARRWDLRGEDANAWYGYGNGLTPEPSLAGEFNVLPAGDQIIGHILPAGMYSHTLSSKHSAVLASPRFQVQKARVFVRMAGGGRAIARYAVQNYPRDGETYPVNRLRDGTWRWQEWDATFWDNDQLYIEISTASDQASLYSNVRFTRSSVEKRNQQRSWFGISEAIVVEDGQSPPRDEWAEFIAPLFRHPDEPATPAELADRYAETLRTCVAAWQSGLMDDTQARFLNYFVSAGLLPNSAQRVSAAADMIAEYRRLENEVPIPRRAPGVFDGDSFDQPLFVRGNHKQPDEPVARRFLEIFDDTPYQPADSGRLHLAESLLHSDNPLPARVIVNRLWHHVFGLGIVATPDDFGQMGEKPSHPELLDYLASYFIENDWSIKDMVRFLATSRTFQSAAIPATRAHAIDPGNRLLSHANLRRLEGEAIRDSMLAVAGRIDPTLFGESIDGTEHRRSLYVKTERNEPDPFLSLFDAPPPMTVVGRRSVTNVPAQALTMLNDPFIIELANAFASRILDENMEATDEDRVVRMFEVALGRAPDAQELVQALTFVDDVNQSAGVQQNDTWTQARIEERRARLAATDPEEDEELRAKLESEIETLKSGGSMRGSWHELAHAIFCMKEFIYLM